MKGILIILLMTFTTSTFVSVRAQDKVITLEAESGELTLPSKAKTGNGYSGNSFVGDNNPGSAIIFHNVYIEKEGTYEFRTYYTSMHIRSIAIKSGNYPKVISTCPRTTPDWNSPPVDVMITYIYLNQGNNTIIVTPHNGGGPNIDKFEIFTTQVSMPRPEPEQIAFNYDLTDDAVITSTGTAENLSYLTDNNEYTVYNFDAPFVEVGIKCDMPYMLTGYLLSPGTGASEDVKKWVLEYSADGVNYFSITPSRTEQLDNSAVFFHINRTPHNDTEQSAQYYKLTSYGGSIGEVQLFGIPYLETTDNKNFPVDITQGLNIQSHVIGQPLGVYNDSFDERCYNLFDRDMSNKYYSEESTGFSVEVEVRESASIDYYTLTSCRDYPERDPRTWVVEGFDRDWEIIDEVNDFVFPTRYATMKFHCQVYKEYKGYRLRTLDNNGADRFQLLKWQIFKNDLSSIHSEADTDRVRIFTSGAELIIQSEKQGQYQVINLSGQEIYRGKFHGPEQRISLTKGIYLVKFVGEKDTFTEKVMVR